MKKFVFILIVLSLILIGCSRQVANQAAIVADNIADEGIEEYEEIGLLPEEKPMMDENIKAEVISPMDRPKERIILKPFGIYINSVNSPVQPERFTGYHSGVDFEILEGEREEAVEVQAACSGSLLDKRWVNGYGGVAIQLCKIEGEFATALYGHLDLDSIAAEKNQMIEQGELIGLLGDDKSEETDKERKHLHFSLHRGSLVNLAGYASAEKALVNWYNPCDFFCD